MKRFTLHHATRRPTRTTERQTTVCVVDPNTGDYQDWRTTAKAHGLQLTFLASAEEALRRGQFGKVDLWVINTSLPDLSGFELCCMLRSRSSSRSAICLVADEYSATEERSAWAARATLFVCKGEHAGWLDEWLHSRLARPSASPTLNLFARPSPIANSCWTEHALC